MVDELLYVVLLILLPVRFCPIRVRIKRRPIVILRAALGASLQDDASNLTHNLIYGTEEISFVDCVERTVATLEIVFELGVNSIFQDSSTIRGN